MPELKSLSRASVSVGLPPTKARAQSATALPGPGIAGSSEHQDQSNHRRNIGRGRKRRKRRRRRRPGGGVVLEFCDAVDHEIVGQGLKTGRRDRIAEDIMRPGHHRVGRHRHIARNQRRSRLSRGRSIKRCGPSSPADGNDTLSCDGS